MRARRWADVVAVHLVDADSEAAGACVADSVLEERVEPVDVAVGVGGFDLGVVVVQSDGCAVVGHAEEQGSSLKQMS